MTTPAPATLEEFLEHIDRDAPTGGSTEEAELEGFLEAGTEAAEGWAPKGRLAVGPIVTREFTDRVRAQRGRLYLPNTPVQSVTSVTHVISGQEYLTDELDVNERRGVVTLLNGCLPAGDYTVVYDAGRGAVGDVPVALKTGVLIISGHLYATQQGPTTNRFIGDANAEDNYRPSAGYLIPNRAAHLLTPYCPIGVA